MKRNNKWEISVLVGLLLTGFLSLTAPNFSYATEASGQEAEGQVGSLEYCPGEGLGWVLCPFIDLSSAAVDATYSMVEPQMRIDPVILTGVSNNTEGSTERPNPTQTIWEAFRDIANIMLIIAFLVMVTSYVSGFGLSNYQIKKMLPKIITAAILINLSFFITQIALDASNIIGGSIKGLFDTITGRIIQDTATVNNSVQNTGVNFGVGINFLITAALGSFVGYKTGQLTPVMIFISPLIVWILLIILTTLIVIFMRQALVIILAVFSPIAFASMLLPNTEKLYKKWKDALIAVLLSYPILALLFGGGHMAGEIITLVGGTTDVNGLILTIIGKTLGITPMILAPSMLRSAIKNIPMVGQAVSGRLGAFSKWSMNRARNAKFNQSARSRWQARQNVMRSRIAKNANRPWSSLGLRERAELVASPLAAIGARTALGRQAQDEREAAQNQEITRLASGLSVADLKNITDLADGKITEAKFFEQLSQRGYDTYNASGGKTGNALGKMQMAAASRLSKDADSSADSYDNLITAAKRTGISDDQIKTMNQQAETNSQRVGNTALYARTSDANAKGQAMLDPDKSTVYSNFLKKSNANVIAGSSAESIREMGNEIRHLNRTDTAFKNMTSGIISGQFNSSVATQTELNKYN